jgi:hypothetical protein
MDRFDQRLEKVGVPVHEWCRDCPHFRDLIRNAEHYGVTPQEIAIAAFRSCTEEPEKFNPVNADGTEKEAWESEIPRCELGKAKQKEDVHQAIIRLGLSEIISLETLYPEQDA